MKIIGNCIKIGLVNSSLSCNVLNIDENSSYEYTNNTTNEIRGTAKPNPSVPLPR